MEEAKPRGGAGLDLQPPVGPNGHFVSSRREKTLDVFHFILEGQNSPFQIGLRPSLLAGMHISLSHYVTF